MSDTQRRQLAPNRFALHLIGIAVLACVPATSAYDLELSWFTIDGGGGASSGGTLQLTGTIAQPDADVPLTGGTFELVGGFWPGAASEPACDGQRGDANCDGAIDFFDIDAFLLALFDPPTYGASYCSGSTCAADVDCSSAVDFFDIDPFLTCLFAACPNCP